MQPTPQGSQLPGYELGKTIGEGNFGKVKLGIHKLSGQQVAIKILEKDLIFEKTDIERISREIKIMKIVKHPSIIQLYEIIETPKELYLIMEYADGGDLFDQIIALSKLPEAQAADYFAQIVLGLEYLHSLGITHRDMKPQNILLSSNSIRIADFGLGSFFEPQQKLHTACGSPCYAPPQMLNKQAYDPRKVDVWSSGVILYGMVHGYLPFEDESNPALYQKIKTKNFRMASWVTLPCRNMLRGLLLKKPTQRWDITTIKQHEFIRNEVKKHQQIIAKQRGQINSQHFHELCLRLGIVQQQRLLTLLKKNKHNNLTTLYYLGKKRIEREDALKGSRTKQVSEKGSVRSEQRERSLVNESSYGTIETSLEKIDVENVKKNQDEHDLRAKIFSFQERVEEIEMPIQTKQLNEKINVQKDKQKQINNTNTGQNGKSQMEKRIADSPPEEPPENILTIPTPIVCNTGQTNSFANIVISSEIPITTSFVKPVKPVKLEQPGMKVIDSPKTTQKQQPIGSARKQLKRTIKPTIVRPEKKDRPVVDPPKLYQRSHSKDRPILLKNNMSSRQVKTNNQFQQSIVTGKAVHQQSSLIDPDRLILCSGEQLCNLLGGKGLSGRVEYFSYGKDCVYLIRHSLKSTKRAQQKGYRFELSRIVGQINAG